MNRTDKLIAKLKDGTIDLAELENLLGRMGWELKRQKGSHRHWAKGELRYTLVAGRRDLKDYQIRDMQKLVLGVSNEEASSEKTSSEEE